MGSIARNAGKASFTTTFLFGGAEIYNGYQQDGGQYGHNAQRATAGVAGGVVGGYIGSRIFGSLGTAVGGPVGGVVGSIAGGMVGGYYGTKAGEAIFDYATKEE